MRFKIVLAAVMVTLAACQTVQAEIAAPRVADRPIAAQPAAPQGNSVVRERPSARPPARPQPIAAVTLQMIFKGCTVEEIAAVTDAFGRAAPLVDRAIALIQREPGHANYAMWFGNSRTKDVLSVYSAIAERFRSRETLQIHCNTQPICAGGTFAYTSGGRLGSSGPAIMGFCQRFFNAANDGFDSRPGTVVHEMSHLAANTVDIVYGPSGARRLAAKQPVDASRNADNIEYFIETLP